MKTVYLLNSPVLTAYGLWRYAGPISVAQARQRLQNCEVRSAIGHEASAALLARLLERPVAVQRVRATLEPGDCALVLRLLDRLPEGMVLDDRQLAETPHELSWMEFVESAEPGEAQP
ncbi:MAG: DUF1874 domain-containing protein [Burkholderiaceae bacterium]|nr:MAG: DUF1874 domain-containing protein [Burkholderiaceae bacterium]